MRIRHLISLILASWVGVFMLAGIIYDDTPLKIAAFIMCIGSYGIHEGV